MEVVYNSTTPVLFSDVVGGLFREVNRKWKPFDLIIKKDGLLYVSRVKKNGLSDSRSFSMSTIILTLIEDNEKNNTGQIALKLVCENVQGDTVGRRDSSSFSNCRFIFDSKQDLQDFCSGLSAVSQSHNVDDFLKTVIAAPLSELRSTANDEDSSSFNRMSIMRQALVRNKRETKLLTRGVDKLETHHLNDEIAARRGAFKQLPVLFANDLVHGSWWFVIGSLFFTVTSAIVIYNDVDILPLLSEDDSKLPRSYFKTAWAMMVLSGVIFTLGSFFFVRAMHEPPMAPLFTWYHISTNELLASWLFLLGILPAIPYCIIFLALTHEEFYLYLLGVLIVATLGSFLFVLSTYPPATATASDHEMHSSTVHKLLLRFCCCSNFVNKHCANDWLLGTWLMFWATFVGAVGFSLYTLYCAVKYYNKLFIFVNFTASVDTFLFLIGCAYFVAGSYPVDPIDIKTTVVNMDNNIKTSSSSSTSSQQPAAFNSMHRL